MELLRNLEPVQLFPGKIAQRQHETVDTIVFTMSGVVEVGYNDDFLLLANGLISKEEMGQKLIDRMKSRKMGGGQKRDKFRYCLKLMPGRILGIFEMVFKKPSQLVYRMGVESDLKPSFFIRKHNFNRIISPERM